MNYSHIHIHSLSDYVEALESKVSLAIAKKQKMDIGLYLHLLGGGDLNCPTPTLSALFGTFRLLSPPQD